MCSKVISSICKLRGPIQNNPADPWKFQRWCTTNTNPMVNKHKVKDYTLGQPCFETHPHIVKKDEVGAGIRREEFQERRSKLMAALLRHGHSLADKPSEHFVIIPSATKQYMSEKIPYVFRQNTDFYYLTGCLEPDSYLMLHCKENVQRSLIFMRKRNTLSEMWDGPRTGVERAADFFGCEEAGAVEQLERFLYACFKEKNSMIWYDYTQCIQPEFDKTIKGIHKETQSRLWLSPTPFIQTLRAIKSPAEIVLMQKTCDVAAEAFIKTMQMSRPGCTEHELFAKIDYECRMQGAEYLAYPPVVAGGKRANIIHYINNNQVIQNNELVLVDAGSEYHGYSSDITRTWPVNGKFTDPQRVLYEVLLEVQKTLINICKEFPTIDQLLESMYILLGRQLSSVHLIPTSLSAIEKARLAYKFCPHHVSHYLGMDVHDTSLISRTSPIIPGMVITIEPGIYITENLNVPQEFKNIGMRIEDDVLITKDGPVVLSRNCPKEVDQIEQYANKPTYCFESTKLVN